MNSRALVEEVYEKLRVQEETLRMENEDVRSRAVRELRRANNRCDTYKERIHKLKKDYKTLEDKILQKASKVSSPERATEEPSVGRKRTLESTIPIIPDVPSTNKKKPKPSSAAVSNWNDDDMMEFDLQNSRPFKDTHKLSASKRGVTIAPLQLVSSSSSSSKHAAHTSNGNSANNIATDFLVEPPPQPRKPLAERKTVSLQARATSSSKYTPKYIEVVRKKEERAALPGHTCSECKRFYEVYERQGMINDDNREYFLQCCSRHKAKWAPAETPEGFWDLSINTPEAWKQLERDRLDAENEER